MLTERAHFVDMLKEKLAAARNQMKLKADWLRSEKQFQVGDLVLLKLQPYAQHMVVNRPYGSFRHRGDCGTDVD
jgi:hypothetical protein